jgi:proline iminopeptidase
MRLPPLVIGVLIACASTRAQGQAEVNQAVMAAGMNRYRFTRFEALTMPVLVIAGKHDGAVIPAGLRPLAEKLLHARWVEFENSGHFVYLDEPDRFARTVTAFITSTR